MWTFWIFIHHYFSLFVWTPESVQWNEIWKMWSFSFFCKYTKEYSNPIISWIGISSFFLLWMINRFAIDFNRHRDEIDSKLLLEIAILSLSSRFFRCFLADRNCFLSKSKIRIIFKIVAFVVRCEIGIQKYSKFMQFWLWKYDLRTSMENGFNSCNANSKSSLCGYGYILPFWIVCILDLKLWKIQQKWW